MKGIFSSKYSKAPVKGLKKSQNSTLYNVNLKIQLLVKEIRKIEEKAFIKNIIYNTNMNEKIKIFDIIEENDILYIISDKENILKIEKILEDNNNIEKEGILFQNANPMTKKDIEQLYKHELSMCKIKFETIKDNQTANGFGTGFFCLINDIDIPFKKALFTTNHILNKNAIEIGKSIVIEYLNNNKEFEITSNRRCFTNETLDYTCIEILDSDKIDVDNFFKIEPIIISNKNLLKNEEIFILQYPYGGELSFSSGKILDMNKSQLFHSSSTCKGSSGSPIIRRYKNNFVVGIHFGGKKSEDKNFVYYNYATSFDSILLDIRQILFDNNTITGKIKIEFEGNLEVKIINSYENAVKVDGLILDKNISIENNEEQIKDSIIFIDDERLNNFEYIHKFPRKGEYEIKYIFRNLLKSTNYIFYKCSNLIELDLSNFNSNNVSNMCGMFEKCRNLKKINLSKLNTINVTNMSWMFNECESLTNLNVNNFKTQNVINMMCMFDRCVSLKELDLSNLNAENVKEMISMFWGCESLKILNLTNFKTKNIINMDKMFFGCKSLEKLDLSDFRTNNVTTMQNMFSECSKLKDLNISSFRTPKVTNMHEMFFRCYELKSLDLSKFTTENLINMDGMFADCKSLISLDLSNFNSSNKEVSMNWLFGGTKTLKKNQIKTKNTNILNQL